MALGVGVAMLPVILPETGGNDQVGSGIFDLITSITPIVGLTFSVAVFGLLIVYLGFDRGF